MSPRLSRWSAVTLVAGQLVLLAPLLTQQALSASVATAPAERWRLPSLQGQRVTANRMLPRHEPPPAAPIFSPTPTAEETARARIFPEPIVPVGATPSAEENAALAPALLAYHRQAGLRGAAALEQFLARYPHSPWRASLLVNLGVVYEQHGAFTKAMEAWEDAWHLTRDSTDRLGVAIGDTALAASAETAARFGQVEVVRAKANAAAARPLAGAAASRLRQTLEQVAFIETYPELMIASGPEALKTILVEVHGRSRAEVDALRPFSDHRPTLAGTSLAEVADMARTVGLTFRAVQRDGAVAATVIGHSVCPPGGPDDKGPPPPDPCRRPAGMPSYAFHPVQATLRLIDTPLTYTPPVGRECAVTVSYSHREALQPQIFSFGNLGPRWTLGWTSYVQEVPAAVCLASGCAWIYLEGGWRDTYAQPDANGVYTPHWRTRATLVRTSSSPLAFERRWPDGSVDVYGLSDGAAAGNRRVFRTEFRDAKGLAQVFTYDSEFRLIAVTDALGQVTVATTSRIWPRRNPGTPDGDRSSQGDD